MRADSISASLAPFACPRLGGAYRVFDDVEQHQSARHPAKHASVRSLPKGQKHGCGSQYSCQHVIPRRWLAWTRAEAIDRNISLTSGKPQLALIVLLERVQLLGRDAFGLHSRAAGRKEGPPCGGRRPWRPRAALRSVCCASAKVKASSAKMRIERLTFHPSDATKSDDFEYTRHSGRGGS